MGQQTRVGEHATTVSCDDGFYRVVYHSTTVVKWDSREIILNSNGYRTSTTKTRMNQASAQFNLGFRVYQEDFNWFVQFNGEVIPFTDGMILER